MTEGYENLFTLKNGSVIMDEDLSQKLFIIARENPASTSADSTGYVWNDEGLADLFAKIYEYEVRYVPLWKSWYAYENGRWTKDIEGLICENKLGEFMALMRTYASQINDDDKRDKYFKFVNKYSDHRYLLRVKGQAKSKLIIDAREFDKDPYIVNCMNGTYSLYDHTFKEHEAKDFLTKQTNFDYTVSRDAKCPRWIQFIDEVCQGDKQKADFLQRALGYSLLGEAREECMFILYGKTTRNGKSTLLNTIQYMLGDYSAVAPVGLICKNKRGGSDFESASPVLAGLKGKRFVTMSESQEYGKLDEEKIKLLTGGEEVTARALYQEAMSYLPQFTLWLSCNELPAVSDRSIFASDRIKVIDFNRHFGADERDPHLKDELVKKDSMKGIFNWLVRGYIHYRKDGLKMPKSLQKVVNQYEKDNDTVMMFLEERCLKRADGSIKSKDLYAMFKTWCRSEGYGVISARKFNDEMERHPDYYDRAIKSHGYYTYYGIGVQEIV